MLSYGEPTVCLVTQFLYVMEQCFYEWVHVLLVLVTHGHAHASVLCDVTYCIFLPMVSHCSTEQQVVVNARKHSSRRDNEDCLQVNMNVNNACFKVLIFLEFRIFLFV